MSVFSQDMFGVFPFVTQPFYRGRLRGPRFLLWLASHQWSSFVQFYCNWGSPASFNRDKLRRSGTTAGVNTP